MPASFPLFIASRAGHGLFIKFALALTAAQRRIADGAGNEANRDLGIFLSHDFAKGQAGADAGHLRAVEVKRVDGGLPPLLLIDHEHVSCGN